MKDELGGNVMKEFAALRRKTYSYLMDDGKNNSGTHVIEKAKGTKKCVIKKILTFNDYKDCLLNYEIIKDHNKGLRVKNIMYILIYYINENKIRTQFKNIYSRSSIQNTYYMRFWIWKNKCNIKFNKQSARY